MSRSSHADNRRLEHSRASLFLDQLEKLTYAVEALKAKKPDEYQRNASTKLLAALNKLVFQTIPADLTATVYRQGSTLAFSGTLFTMRFVLDGSLRVEGGDRDDGD